MLVGSAAAAPTKTAPAVKPPAASRPLLMQEFDAFRNKTLEQKIQELADREEIRELITRYAHCVAQGHSAADLYTDDGAYISHNPTRPVREVRGGAEIDKMYNRMAHATEHPLPMIHNYLISISGDDASGICSNEVRITEEGGSMIGSGYYLDTYRRMNGRWKFVVREPHFFHRVPIQEGWAKKPDKAP